MSDLKTDIVQLKYRNHIPATKSVFPSSPIKVDDTLTQDLAPHIIIPNVLNKGQAVALPITIDLMVPPS
jgi:hypothetical protein